MQPVSEDDAALQNQVNAAGLEFDTLCMLMANDLEMPVVLGNDAYESALISLAVTVNAAKMQAIGIMLTHAPETNGEPQIGAQSFIPAKDKDKDKK